MKLVDTNDKHPRQKDLNYLQQRKTQLTEKIRLQEKQIGASVEAVFSPASFTNYAVKFFTKSFNLFDSFLIGYKMIRSFRRLFKR